MRRSHPFLASDLESLEALFEQMTAVVPMRAVAAGQTAANVLGLRHDVDDNQGSFEAAVKMARWEADRGYGSTYFLLHTASYWGTREWRAGVHEMLELGHEVGIHVNSVADCIRNGYASPEFNLRLALWELRQEGPLVIGSVAHGDELCRRKGGGYRFVNDEMFTECARPEMGEPDRIIEGTSLRLNPQPLSKYGLEYDSNRLPRRFYASDSGGNWSQPWEQTVSEALSSEGQLHMLIHPDWWTEAF